MTIRNVLLVANLVLVLAALVVAVGLLFAVMFLLVPWTGDNRGIALLIPACGLLAAAITWLTVRCLRAFEVRLAIAIAVLSIPVYVVFAIPSWESSGERALATTFLNGDAAASAAARSKLEAKGRHTNNPAVPVLIEGLHTPRMPSDCGRRSSCWERSAMSPGATRRSSPRSRPTRAKTPAATSPCARRPSRQWAR